MFALEAIERKIRQIGSEGQQWKKAREVSKSLEIPQALFRIATELRNGGDRSALIEEYSQGWNTRWYTLALRWDLETSGAAVSSWMSKGVRVEASHEGMAEVVITGVGWIGLDTFAYRYFGTAAPSEAEYRLRGMPYQNWSLGDKIKFGMDHALHDSDYRYGAGDKGMFGRLITRTNIGRIVFPSPDLIERPPTVDWRQLRRR